VRSPPAGVAGSPGAFVCVSSDVVGISWCYQRKMGFSSKCIVILHVVVLACFVKLARCLTDFPSDGGGENAVRSIG
jgi:hypothetical protein